MPRTPPAGPPGPAATAATTPAGDRTGARDALAQAVEKMRRNGTSDAGIEAFRQRFGHLVSGDRGLLPSRDLEPVAAVPALADLGAADTRAALGRTVLIKLNGGLGTSMGLSAPKSLVEARPGVSFLDVIVRQVLALRRAHGARLPLVVMNSPSTRAPTLAALARHPDLPADVPLDFLQHVEPKLGADDLRPVTWPADPRLEWCPPGHGDLYSALAGSGMLEALRAHGYDHAFVSNADNLGAVLDPRILGWVAAEEIPFLMEVVQGTEADRKGGHIACRDGRPVLRETAQTPAEDADSFGDFRRWRFYNTNNLWLDLRRLGDGLLDLPLIVNRKTVDPGDPASPEVLQLETAMGAALGAIDGARLLEVARSRFAPVKTTNDLLVVRSDAYALTDDGRMEPCRETPTYVDLDPRFYARLDEFEARFPAGPPSLRRCRRLVVRGDVTFGRGVVAVGHVAVEGPSAVPDGAILEGPAAVSDASVPEGPRGMRART